MIGATTSQSLDLTLLNKGDIVYGTSTIKVEIGLKIGSTIEYIPMGIYNIDDIEKTDYTIKITAFDNMMKFEKNFITNLGDTLTLQQVVNELARITGVQFTGTLPSYSVKKLEGFSCREVLSYVASLCGGNAVITRDGKFTIVMPKDIKYSIGTANYFNYTREETKYKIGKISCQVADKVLSKGSLGADSMELEFENPWVTDSILQDIYSKLNGFEYLGYSMKWQGDLSLDVGDIVTITDKKGVVRKHPILSQKITYTGGLTSEISAKGENKNKNEFSGSGPSTKKIERVFTELAIVNKALIDVAYIDDLTAGNIKFDTASGNIMDLQTLLAKFVTGENGQFLNLTTDNVTISNALIKDVIAKNISVEDLKAGKISTNKFRITSDNGGIEIVGATQQFKDKNNRVRIQMGQDTQGNFNFILRGEDGTTTLIDHTGIKEKAIADNLIKEKMIAENAVGEKQINYSSLVTGLNKDTNTSLIKASKVAIDLTGQSLEVAFNSLKSNVDNMEIGGRNLVKDSDTLQNLLGFTGGFAGVRTFIDDDEALCKKQIQVKCTTATPGGGVHFPVFAKDANKIGKTYTWSFWAKCSSNKTLRVGHESGGVISIDLTTSWQKFTHTWKFTDYQYSSFLFYGIYAVNDILYIRDFKIEEGTKPTDWTAAPEDIDSKIESNTTAISVAQGKIEGLIKESTIVKGDVTTLKDKYTSIKATVDGINSTVVSHTTSITNLGTNVTNAQNTANKANSLADSKAKVFTTTPTTPYKIGDLWVQGTSGDVMRCKVARASGNYVASDWEKASKYTDDTKANSVEKNLNTLGGKVTTVENKQASLEQNLNGFKTTVSNTYSTKKELTTLDGKVVGLTSRVSTAESSITQLNNKIALKVEATEVNSIVNNAVDGIQIGGRNLAQKTSNEYSEPFVGFTGSTNRTVTIGAVLTDGLAIGDTLSIRLIYKYDDIIPATGQMAKCWLQGSGDVTGWNSGAFNSSSAIAITGSGIHEFTHQFIITENHLKNRYWSTAIRHDYVQSGSVQWKMYKVEKGKKNTDWTPAPEDVDSAISTVDSKITTTNNKVASIEANLSSITQRVSSTESTVSTINGNVTNLTSRVSTAESKLTATSLTTTISSAINAGTSSISTTQFVMDKNGLTIKNGALTIKNKAGTNVLASDTSGNLTIIGAFINKNSNGVKAIEINNTNIYFYDWERNGRELGIIYSSYLLDYPNCRGFSLAHNSQGYLTLGYRKPDSSFGAYAIFDKYAKNPAYNAPIRFVESAVFSQAVNMQNRVYVPNTIYLGANAGTTVPMIFGTNNRLVMQVSVSNKDDGLKIQTNTGGILAQILAGYSYPILLNNNTQVSGNLSVTGSKNSLQLTDNYGERLINAIESAEYYYSDFGFGKINDDGECYISIDDILQECVNLDCEYHIFTQKYNGDITSIDRHRDYFIVYGEPETKFSWQYIAKRIGYENVRLDVPDIGTIEDIPVFTDEDLKVKTVEDALLDVLTFKLEDILMEG